MLFMPTQPPTQAQEQEKVYQGNQRKKPDHDTHPACRLYAAVG